MIKACFSRVLIVQLKVHDCGPHELLEEVVQLPEAEPERGLPLPQHLRARGLWQELLCQDASEEHEFLKIEGKNDFSL